MHRDGIPVGNNRSRDAPSCGLRLLRHRPAAPRYGEVVDLSIAGERDRIASVIVTPDLYERERVVATRSKFILAEGSLQNQDGVIHVKVMRPQTLTDQLWGFAPHDFH